MESNRRPGIDRVWSRALTIVCAVLLAGAASAPAKVSADSPVQHLVLFDFRDDVPDAKVAEVLEAFDKLPSEIPGISGFQWGINNSPEGLAKTFTHGFIITFESAEARDEYLPHPAHSRFVDLVKPTLNDVFVIDFSIDKVPPPAEPGRVHHLVFFKYKEGTSSEAIDEVNQAFAALPSKIAGLMRYQAGKNNSPEGLNKRFTHGYLLTFNNERARDDYLPHPAHKEFGSIVRKVLAEPLVLDFTVAPSAQRLFVTRGLEPYRVYQRGEDGKATIRFGGVARDAGAVEARLRAGRRTVSGQDWRVVGQSKGGTFDVVLEGVPTGGEYTVEVRLRDALGNVASHTEVADILVGDIWILAGQSNMQGVGKLGSHAGSDPLVHCFTMGQRWELANEPLHWLVDSPDPVHNQRWFRGGDLDESKRRTIRANARKARTTGAGLGLPFAKELVRRTGVPVGLIASAHGGTSMEQWDPSGRDDGGARLYGSMYKQLQNAGGSARGVLWYQGESDAGGDRPEKFLERFKGLVAAFRKDLENPELPFYYVQIGRHVTPMSKEGHAAWSRIQELQRVAASQIPNTAVISVMDLPLDDPIHVGTEGLVRAGHRLAKVAHRELFGADSLRLGPKVEKIELSEDRRRIRVNYSGFNGILGPSAAIHGFSLVDANGEPLQRIYKASIDPASPSTVVLELRQPVPQGAMLYYGRGRDSVCNLVDSEDMAALAFGPHKL